MEHTKANKSKILALILGLTMCLALMLGIVFASPTSTVYAEGGTQIDTLGVAFRKVEVGNTLDAAFEFENATTKTLKVPEGANYTATLEFVSKDGQKIPLWDKYEASLPWSRVETQFIEQNVAYYVRVCFKTNEGYKFVKDLPRLRSNMQVLGAEFGKGKDIELWDSAGINSIATIVKMSFLITKGMTYIGNTQTIYPEIGKSKTGTIGIDGVDTGFFISGAPGPYTYEAKIAPIGTEIQTSNVFDKSNCYYQITAKNAMGGGTMYITATAADGKTCDIPVKIAAVSGGHEHTWVEKIEKIDFEHHGYTKCTDPDCPGVAPAFDKGSQYAVHEFNGGCTEKCTTCGDLGNPNAKHNLKLIAVKPATCSTTGMNAHYTCEGCGKYFDEDKTEKTVAELTIPTTDDHTFGTLIKEQPATCIAGGMKAHYKCTVCGKYFDENKNETTEEALKTSVSPYYGHNFGRWVEEQYATCQAPGREGYKHCSICNKDYDASNKEITDFVIPINPDGHVLGDLVAEVPATCKEHGVKAHRDCNLCGKHCDPITRKEIADLTIPATNNHTYSKLIPEVPATTTEFGVKEHKDCSVCGKHFDKDGNEITELRIAKIGTHNVIVNGESKFYAHGESVTVTAEEKDGKVFTGWQDESGKIVSTKKEYTFTVNGETTLTAVYEDKSSGGGEITPPAKKDGLSGGQIAGIVIGSVLLAGLGGFAVLWFAVKKKTFADLIAAIKALFTKKK